MSGLKVRHYIHPYIFLKVWTPDLASKELLALVHTEEYVDNFIHGKTSPEEDRLFLE